MVLFDVRRPNFVSLDRALSEIQSGWIAQFRGIGWSSRWIEYGTGGPYSHSAMLHRNEFEKIDLLETVMGCGGHIVAFENIVDSYPGHVDIYRPDLERFPEYNGKNAARYMRSLSARKYGWWGVHRLFWQKVPLMWRLWRLQTDDLLESKAAPFCSHAVGCAARIGGGVDPVPNKPDDRTTPNDLAWSLLFQYQYTVQTKD